MSVYASVHDVPSFIIYYARPIAINTTTNIAQTYISFTRIHFATPHNLIQMGINKDELSCCSRQSTR